ncbi:MAG: hypothetical protein IT449_07770 [Phycisphaerales bacterium]|nr:hypothetical protein [Phycisphaerales bacterium]
MRDFDELKLARVIDACGGIDGRVKMQKIVYLLREMGYDLPFRDFAIRQLGPYSRLVAWATDTLKIGGIIEEDRKELGTNPTTGELVVQYTYHAREEPAALIREHYDVTVPPGKPPLTEIAPRLKRFDRDVLEVAATQVFLEREGLRDEQLDVELFRLKGHLMAKFGQAKELLSDLKADGLLR